MIEDRMQESKKRGSVIGHYNGSKIAHYGNVMQKLSLDKDTVIRELKKYFGDDVVIPEEIWEAPKARRGRPKGSTKKSAATSDTDEEKPKKKRGRPSKKVVEESNEGDDLISQLVKGAATDSSDGDGGPIVEKPAKKTAKKGKTKKQEQVVVEELTAEIPEEEASEEEVREDEVAEKEVGEEEVGEEEVDDSDDEGELSVEPKTIGGKEYLVDPDTKQVFDADAEEAVAIGTWNEEDDCVDPIEE